MFPLRGAILLPRATLPLNIFEPRYLDMIDDVMSGGRVIGILQPMLAGDDDQESPLEKSAGLRSVGCAGRILPIRNSTMADLIITLTGVSRFACVGEAETDKPYRIMSVSYDRFANRSDGRPRRGTGRPAEPASRAQNLSRGQSPEDRLVDDPAGFERISHQRFVGHVPVRAGREAGSARGQDLRSRAEVLVALAEIDLASNGSSGTTLQ